MAKPYDNDLRQKVIEAIEQDELSSIARLIIPRPN